MKIFAIGVAVLGVAGVVTAGAAPVDTAGLQVRPAVFGAPLPLDPVPAPVEPVTQGAPLPTTDEVSGMLTRLTDAGIGYKEKGDLVENGITQAEGHELDHQLRKAYRDGELPYTFTVLNVAPTGPGQAVANVTITGPKKPVPQTLPLTLVDQGRWVLSHDAATGLAGQLAGP